MSVPPSSTPAETPATSFSITEPANTPATSFTTPEPEDIDKYHLERYILAQDNKDIYNRVLAAVRDGRRKPQPATWLWCVFPQMNGCKTGRRRDIPARDKWPPGHALSSLDEARAILRHRVLGPRARAAAQALVDSRAADIFTAMDNMFYDVARVHSCITIFRQAARYPVCIHERAPRLGENRVFREVLDRYFIKEPNSEDDDYKEEDEDQVRNWGSRHGPTLERLDVLELEAAERRLAAGEACVCGKDSKQLFDEDIGSKFKIMDKQRARLMKG